MAKKENAQEPVWKLWLTALPLGVGVLAGGVLLFFSQRMSVRRTFRVTTCLADEKPVPSDCQRLIVLLDNGKKHLGRTENGLFIASSSSYAVAISSIEAWAELPEEFLVEL